MAAPVGLCAQIACIWEATARKPGNVHRYCDFADTTYLDFILSATAVAPVLDAAARLPVGDTVLHAIRATRQVVKSNTNLGIVLLLAPLCAAPPEEELDAGVRRKLEGLTVEDARAVYEAIRLAHPGGLGQAPEQDVSAEPTESLRHVMTRAADRDLVARQYANAFREVFQVGLPAFRRGLEMGAGLEPAIIACHLELMATHPDTLIARKRGRAEAEESWRRASVVLQTGGPFTASGRTALQDFDVWLRAEGNARNPGTTADLVTASLFAALRDELVRLPPSMPWNDRADPRVQFSTYA
jgi:triphosphoribosyl-dephospho-CoA synthase